MISISLLKGEKTKDDYGSAALKESEDILQKMLDTIEFEEEHEKSNSEQSKCLTNWDSIPATNPKKKSFKAMQKGEEKYIHEILKRLDKDEPKKTILDLEKNNNGNS